MTRPTADSDPWLTDMVSRDREIAKTVVYGMRTIISLLRGIRDELAEESRAARVERREMRQEIRDLWGQVAKGAEPPPGWHRISATSYPHCKRQGCSLPDGHTGNHQGSLRSA